MRARAFLPFLSLALLILAGMGGCENVDGVFPENQMPKTYLSILSPGGPTDTTDYRKILNWWGTDSDGKVTGYLIRWTGDWTPAAGTAYEYDGLTYSLTTATTDTFNIPVGGTFAMRSFTVRAVDNAGLVDSIGVSQAYQVTNHIPHIQWNPDFVLPDTSLAALGFGWNASDFDGRETVGTYKVWIDDDSLHARTVGDTIVSLQPEDFPDRIDAPHTIHVRAYDDARTPSVETISHTWFVRWPSAEQKWLLLQQYTSDQQIDRWDRKVFEAILNEVTGGPETLYRIDMNARPDFATKAEIDPLFSLFDGVVWLAAKYDAGRDAKMARNVAIAESGIRSYVESGGRVLMIGETVVGTDSGLSTRFVKEVLGIPGYYYKTGNEPGEVTTTSLTLDRDEYVFFDNGGQADSIKVFGSSSNTDYFRTPLTPGLGRYWVSPGTIRRMIGEETDPPQADNPAYIGVVSAFGSGRITVVTNAYARLFPNPGTADPTGIDEGVALFREALLP